MFHRKSKSTQCRITIFTRIEKACIGIGIETDCIESSSIHPEYVLLALLSFEANEEIGKIGATIVDQEDTESMVEGDLEVYLLVKGIDIESFLASQLFQTLLQNLINDD